jgi:hypothetical protein
VAEGLTPFFRHLRGVVHPLTRSRRSIVARSERSKNFALFQIPSVAQAPSGRPADVPITAMGIDRPTAAIDRKGCNGGFGMVTRPLEYCCFQHWLGHRKIWRKARRPTRIALFRRDGRNNKQLTGGDDD